MVYGTQAIKVESSQQKGVVLMKLRQFKAFRISTIHYKLKSQYLEC